MSSPADQDYVELFRLTFDAVWRFVRRRVASADDADDVSAEVFTVAWRRRSEWPPPDQRRLWLFGVARHALQTHKRSGYRQERLAGRLVALDEVEPRRPEPAPEDRRVWLALAALDAGDRELLIMRAWDQLTLPEIAQLLDCTANAASIRLTRARTKLRTQLDRLAAQESTDGTKDRDGDGHEEGTRPREETNP